MIEQLYHLKYLLLERRNLLEVIEEAEQLNEHPTRGIYISNATVQVYDYSTRSNEDIKKQAVFYYKKYTKEDTIKHYNDMVEIAYGKIDKLNRELALVNEEKANVESKVEAYLNIIKELENED